MQDYIKIDDAEIVEDGLLTHASYHLRGVRLGEPFQIDRRYNDFVTLKEALIRNWPGCFIPPIPSKKSLGNLDSNVISYRTKYLNHFVKKLIKIPHIWVGRELTQFIRSNEISYETMNQIKEKYRKTFAFQPCNHVEIENFTAYINATLPMIENFQKMAKNILKARDLHNYEQVLFIENFLPQFEQTQYFKDPIFSQEDAKDLFAPVKKIYQKNEFIKLYDYTKSVERELEACKDALQYRIQQVNKARDEELQLNQLKVKLGEAHTKISLFTSKEEKAEQLKQQIQQKELIVADSKEYVDMINQLILGQEIKEFLHQNKDKYRQILKFIAQFELKYAQAQVDYWEKVLLKI